MSFIGKLEFKGENLVSLIEDSQALGFKCVNDLLEKFILEEPTTENWDNLLSCSYYLDKHDTTDRCFEFLKVVCFGSQLHFFQKRLNAIADSLSRSTMLFNTA